MRLLSLLLIFCFVAVKAQDLQPGVDRWSIKTSTVSGTAKKVDIKDILAMAEPPEDKGGAFDNKRMDGTFGPDKLKEGDIVVTTGWIHLVALEDDAVHHRDGDYHIQVTNSATSGDNCMIVEIPDPDFVKDPALKTKCVAARQFIKDKLLNGKEPSKTGNEMQHQVYVQITGQFYADLPHVANNNRGKKGMHSTNVWELHPVTDIKFVPKPK